MTSIILNYSVLYELWDWSLDTSTLIEMKVWIRGVQVHMQQFEFFFGLVLGRNLPQHTDSLSVCLQRKSLSAAEGQAMAGIGCHDHQNIEDHDSWWYICSVLAWCNRGRISSKNLLVRRTSGFAKPLVRNEIHLSHPRKS